MKPGPGKVLPGYCTLVEEAEEAIVNIEKQWPAEAGLIRRMAEKLTAMEKIIGSLGIAFDEFESTVGEALLTAEGLPK